MFEFPSKPVRYTWSVPAVCTYAVIFPAYFQMTSELGIVRPPHDYLHFRVALLGTPCQQI
jgi:hypothetical protein